MASKESIEDLVSELKSAQSVCVLTGAGVSAESGVPTFRDPEGLWAKFRPEELASIDGFMSNPDLVWEWYTHRREIIGKVKPNPGHKALVELENRFENFTLVTQNVDGLHQEAGSKNIVELHGNIRKSFCMDCQESVGESEAFESKAALKCTSCGGWIRPGVVWFGEMLPMEAVMKADKAVKSCDFVFSVGTSSVVYPAAALPYEAKNHGAKVVEINIGPTELTPQADYFLSGPSGEVLPKIVRALGAV